MAKLKLFITLVLVVLTVFVFGCNRQAPIIVDDTSSTPETVNLLVDANNKFAFDLYATYESRGNVFFSPYSISSAFAMVNEGAKGATADEINKVFYFPADISLVKSSYANIYNEINKEDKEYKLSTANALWAQKDYLFLQEYLSNVEKYYGGKATNLDFIGENAKSKKIVNNWVEDQTNDKIKDLIPTIDPMTRLILTNAVYFKGKWLEEFDEDDTTDEDFKVSPENTIKSRMMHLTEDFKYAENEDYQALELTYKGKELSMIIFLPKDVSSEALKNIDYTKFTELVNKLNYGKVQVSLPKFKMETMYDMNKDLIAMGMPTAFDNKTADFSGMTGKPDLFISKVIHKAFVEVDEEGTEAAAATGIMMEMKATAEPEEPVIFNADHPFMFVIKQNTTGNILFVGKVEEPKTE